MFLLWILHIRHHLWWDLMDNLTLGMDSNLLKTLANTVQQHTSHQWTSMKNQVKWETHSYSNKTSYSSRKTLLEMILFSRRNWIWLKIWEMNQVHKTSEVQPTFQHWMKIIKMILVSSNLKHISPHNYPLTYRSNCQYDTWNTKLIRQYFRNWI